MTTEEKLARIIPVPITIDTIKINNHAINYIKAGRGKPLLLLHGGNVGWGQWFGNIAELAKKHTVYAVDYPGAGRSSRLDYRNLDINKDLFETLKKFIIAKNLKHFDVVGSSIGGWLTLQLALDKDISIDKIVVTNGIGFTSYVRPADRIISIYPFAKLISKTALKPVRSNKNVEKFLRDVFYDKNLSLPDEFIDYFYETMKTSHNLLFISKLSNFWGMRKEFVLEDNLRQIKNKTLIIWGNKDKMMPLDKNEEAFYKIPNVTVEIFDNTGHMPSVEKSKQFNKKVLEFLK